MDVVEVYRGVEIRRLDGGFAYTLGPNRTGASSTLEQARKAIDDALEEEAGPGQDAPPPTPPPGP